MKKLTLTSALSGLIWLSLPSMAHIEQSEPFQSLRQSYFALLGMTFAPMGDMVKGKIEWDDDRFSSWANDLHHVAQVGVERGFAPGSGLLFCRCLALHGRLFLCGGLFLDGSLLFCRCALLGIALTRLAMTAGALAAIDRLAAFYRFRIARPLCQ